MRCAWGVLTVPVGRPWGVRRVSVQCPRGGHGVHVGRRRVAHRVPSVMGVRCVNRP